MAIHLAQKLNLNIKPYDIDANNPRIGAYNVLGSAHLQAISQENFPVSNVQNVSTREEWRSINTSAPAVIGMTVSPTTVDYFGIAGHNLAGADILLQYCHADSDPWRTVVSRVTPKDNHAIIFLFNPVVSARHWQLLIEPKHFCGTPTAFLRDTHAPLDTITHIQ